MEGSQYCIRLRRFAGGDGRSPKRFHNEVRCTNACISQPGQSMVPGFAYCVLMMKIQQFAAPVIHERFCKLLDCWRVARTNSEPEPSCAATSTVQELDAAPPHLHHSALASYPVSRTFQYSCCRCMRSCTNSPLQSSYMLIPLSLYTYAH